MTLSNEIELASTADLETPALLLYPDAVDRNIDRTIALTGRPDRWRPHIKTIKSAYVMKRLLAKGVTHWKCATPLELEVTCATGVEDVLLSFPVGPAARKRRE